MSVPTIFLWDGVRWHEARLPVLAFADVIKREGDRWWQVSIDGSRVPITLPIILNGTTTGGVVGDLYENLQQKAAQAA